MSIIKSGFLKTTLINYPGKIACIIFLSGCNLRCPFCHNKDLVLEEEEDTLTHFDDILKYIERRKNILQGVCISGGEPMMYKNLPQIVEDIRSAGSKELKIKIDTNGTYPDALFDAKPDYIAMDIKTSPSKYNLLLSIEKNVDNKAMLGELVEKSIRTIMKSSIEYEFRTTLVPGITDADDIKEIANLVKGCKCYTLNRFVPRNTLDPAFIDVIPYSEEKYQELAAIFQDEGIPAQFRGN